MTPRFSSHSCERARAQVSLRLDGELSPFEDAELRQHLARCGSCSVFEVDTVALTKMVQSTPVEPAAFPILLPRRQWLSLRQAQVAVAAGVVAAVGVGAALGILRGNMISPTQLTQSASSSAVDSSARPAYMDSAAYELRLIALARDSRQHGGTSRAVAL